MKALCLCALVAAGLAGAQSEPWSSSELVQPDAVAKTLREGKERPVIIYVGFARLYAATRLPGARFGGPASTPAGLQTLRKELSAIPRDRPVIVYCGCCPWDHCPNVRPAFRLLREMRFRNAKLLYIAGNMHSDWIEKSYPVERPSGTPAP